VPDNAGQPAEILRVEGIAKSFGSVVALNGVSFSIYENEIVGLVGDNGAGKSTLVKILAGNFPPDRGTIHLGGEPVSFGSPVEARKAGVETVYQDLALCENLDSAANFFIGREICGQFLGFKVLKRREMESRTTESIRNLGINLPSVRENVEFLSGGQRQALALARIMAWKRRLILLDEPTAALGVREGKLAMELVNRIGKGPNLATIVIAHNLQQVFQVADRVVVLRHGEVAGVRVLASTTADEVVSLITGAGAVAAAPAGASTT
jgi:ribose transport system ATP-binding protein